jgi:hypothetical protein
MNDIPTFDLGLINDATIERIRAYVFMKLAEGLPADFEPRLVRSA